MAVTNVPTLIAPMNAGRWSALRARLASQTGRGIARRGSEAGREDFAPEKVVGTALIRAKGGRMRARLDHACPATNY